MVIGQICLNFYIFMKPSCCLARGLRMFLLIYAQYMTICLSDLQILIQSVYLLLGDKGSKWVAIQVATK